MEMTDTNDYRDSTSAVFDPWRVLREREVAMAIETPEQRGYRLRQEYKLTQAELQRPRPWRR